MHKNTIMSLKIGSKVSVLHETTIGKVLSIEGKNVWIETTDGFQIKYDKKELVVYKEDLDWVIQSNNPEDLPRKIEPKKPKKARDRSVVDLHYEGTSKTSQPILGLQLTHFKAELNKAIKAGLPEITFIHGVGEGKLRNEIEKILIKNTIEFSDAPYSQFGTDGAIKVYLSKVKKQIF